MGRIGRAALGNALITLLAARGAWAYIPTLTAQGGGVTWRGSLKLDLAGNPANRSSVDAQSFRDAVVRGLQRWQFASGGQIGFDYWQGTDPAIYSPNSDYDGQSSVYFASNANVDQHLSSNVLGLTEVWYDTHSGQILETDIVLNDLNFQFTTNPQDTSGYGSGGPSGSSTGKSKVYIENVITHELGHAFGLSHSGGLQSTMLFMESPEQAHLGCDEQVAIHALYGGADAGTRGAIAGNIVSEGGQPVFGAHVVAISRRRGTSMATGVTDAQGRYQISALEAGTYFLMVEPYYAGPSALPGFYAGMDSSICGGNRFSRSFYVDSTGYLPVPVKVGGGGIATAEPLVARCESSRGASVGSPLRAEGYDTAPEIFRGATGGFGVTEKFGMSGMSAYYKLSGVSGHLEIHGVSYSLYSPVHAALALLDSEGAPVISAQVAQRVYEGDSGFVNYDTSLVVEGLAPGDYTLRVLPSTIDATRYPAGSLPLDSAPFLLITGSVNEPAPPLVASLANNARCRMSESFSTYTSPPGNPPRVVSKSGDEKGSFGFCGSIAASGGKGGKSEGSGKNGSSAPPFGGLVGWMLPWIAMLWIARVSKILIRSTRRADSLHPV